MATQYLLPCTCGKTTPVVASQAGGSVLCSCGQQLEIPTLRGLRELETADPKSPGRPTGEPTWSVWQGVMLLGLVIAVVAAIPGVNLLVNYPVAPKPDVQKIIDHNLRRIDEMTIDRAWMEWQATIVLTGLRIEPNRAHQLALHEHQQTLFRRWMIFYFSISAAGIVAAVVAIVTKPARKSPALASAKVQPDASG